MRFSLCIILKNEVFKFNRENESMENKIKPSIELKNIDLTGISLPE